jgi:hypothetical protein
LIAYLISIIRPRAEFHKAYLLVERKVPNVDLAGGLEDGRRGPDDFASVGQNGFGQSGDDVFTIGTGKNKNI